MEIPRSITPRLPLEEYDYDLASITRHPGAELKNATSNPSGLPHDIAVLILSFMEPAGIVKMAAVSKAWSTISASNATWLAVCLKKYPGAAMARHGLECRTGQTLYDWRRNLQHFASMHDHDTLRGKLMAPLIDMAMAVRAMHDVILAPRQTGTTQVKSATSGLVRWCSMLIRTIVKLSRAAVEAPALHEFFATFIARASAVFVIDCSAKLLGISTPTSVIDPLRAATVWQNVLMFAQILCKSFHWLDKFYRSPGAPNAPIMKKILYQEFCERVWQKRRAELIKSFETSVSISSAQMLLNSMVVACDEDPALLGANRLTLDQALPVFVLLSTGTGASERVIRVHADEASLCSTLAGQISLLRCWPHDVDDTASTILPVPGINSETLVAIAAFCELHIDIRRKALASGPPPTPIKPHGVAQAEIDFFHNLEKSEIFSLIMAGHSLGLRALVESAAAAIATLVRGKSPEELRRYFGIKNDFTPEEERDVHAHSGGYWTDM